MKDFFPVDIFKKWHKSFLFLPKKVTSSICSSYPIPFLRIGASLIISYFSLSPIRQQHRSPFDGYKDFQNERRRRVNHILQMIFEFQNDFLFTKIIAIMSINCTVFVIILLNSASQLIVLNNLIKQFNGLFLSTVYKS